jgi:hypothetical protein
VAGGESGLFMAEDGVGGTSDYKPAMAVEPA